METMLQEDEISFTQVVLYASISFLAVSLFGVFIYITCSKKYKLNWFEKNLLETATENDEINQSQEALVGSIPYNIDSVAGSLRSLNRNTGSPISNTDDQTFWVPHGHNRGNICSSEIQPIFNDESLPPTPTSPSESNRSVTISMTSSTVQIARNDKQVVLSTSPARPKVASMQAKLDHTKIDTSLYQKNSPSRGASVAEDMRGSVHMSLLYDPIAGILTVRLMEAQDLQPRDFSGTADPYAKIRLLPDRTNMWQTRIHKRTLNPVFDEDFVFEERPAVIGRRTLEILLYDFDAYSRHVCIGGTQIALAHVDLSDKVDLWKSLGSCSEQDSRVDLGELMVSLSYLPSAERLTVVVIKARNLRVVDDTRNSSDPYVKVSLINSTKKIKKRKTGVHRGTVSPVFNEALIFDISKDTLKNSIIEFLVIHDSLLGSNETLGRSLIGRSSEIGLEERSFFDELFRSKTATAQWISLTDK